MKIQAESYSPIVVKCSIRARKEASVQETDRHINSTYTPGTVHDARFEYHREYFMDAGFEVWHCQAGRFDKQNARFVETVGVGNPHTLLGTEPFQRQLVEIAKAFRRMPILS